MGIEALVILFSLIRSTKFFDSPLFTKICNKSFNGKINSIQQPTPTLSHRNSKCLIETRRVQGLTSKRGVRSPLLSAQTFPSVLQWGLKEKDLPASLCLPTRVRDGVTISRLCSAQVTAARKGFKRTVPPPRASGEESMNNFYALGSAGMVAHRMADSVGGDVARKSLQAF